MRLNKALSQDPVLAEQSTRHSSDDQKSRDVGVRAFLDELVSGEAGRFRHQEFAVLVSEGGREVVKRGGP
eukprot:1176920-Pyramimonas_sp.AAC.1